jgi:hypothetical protein
VRTDSILHEQDSVLGEKEKQEEKRKKRTGTVRESGAAVLRDVLSSLSMDSQEHSFRGSFSESMQGD